MRHHAFRMEMEPGPVAGVCDICLQPLDQPEHLHTYIETQGQSYLCVECAKDGARLTGFIDPTIRADFTCDDCRKTFGRAAALGSHRRTHKE